MARMPGECCPHAQPSFSSYLPIEILPDWSWICSNQKTHIGNLLRCVANLLRKGKIISKQVALACWGSWCAIHAPYRLMQLYTL